MNEAVWLAITAMVGGILLAIALIDIRSFRIPNPLNFALIVLGLGWAAFAYGVGEVWQFALAAIIGYLALFLCNQLYKAVRGKHGIGMGDAKLLAAGGALLGSMCLPMVTLIATSAALVIIILFRVLGKRISGADALPFGPFLAFAIWVVWLWEAPLEIWLLVQRYV